MYKIFDMRTCGLSHQIKGPTTVKLAKSGFNCKICQKSYTSIIITSITWAGPRCVQGAAAILGPQNRTQGRCDALSTSNSWCLLRDCEIFANLCLKL